MKKILYLSGLIILSVAGISCSDDFLLKNNVDLYELSDTLFLYNYQNKVETPLQLPATINSDYTIFMQPKWLSFDSMHGEIKNGSTILSFSIIKNQLPAGYQTNYGKIMLDIDGLGLVSFVVSYTNFGSPVLQCSAAALNFESSGPQVFSLKNISDGILNWKITGMPDWLLISRTSGSLNYGSSIDITASLDPVSIPQGQDLSATLQILSNSTTGSYSLPVHVPAEAIVPAELRQITGIVTDAEYNYETALMVICTKSPNSLILFNSSTNESNTIALADTPNCVSLSEDGHKAVVGYSVPAISYINIDNKEITRDYTIDCIPFDVVLGDNEWCYITPAEDQWVRFRNLNLNSGELILARNEYPLYEGTIIRKVPGKPFLVGSRLSLSPTGLLIFDVTGGIASDTVSYYHESIESFIISRDGSKLYSGYGNVYILPAYDTDYHNSPIPVSGQIRPEFQNITAMDECPALNSIFVTSSIFQFQPGYSTLIEQFSTATLSKIKSFNTSPVSVTENGIKTIYDTSARFIFVNKAGSRMYAINNLKQNYNKDFWTVETFHLK